MTDIVESRTDAFRRHFSGVTLTETDSDYDGARSLWNGSFDRHPAVIARCASAADVAAAITFGRTEGMEIAVRGGAHSFSGASAVDGGLMIDLSPMRTVIVDPLAERARCGGGATLADLDAATQAHGLAVTGGVISHTGIGGLTLGGGMGWLSRKLGLTIDNLVAAEVVLADGRCVRAAEDEHPDLFWALRGGGGNFGVVTNFEFRLHPVGPEIHVGLFFWELARATEALRLSRDVADNLPTQANALIGAGLNAPPAPFVPERYHFVPCCALIVVGFASSEEHDELIRPVRHALPPLFEFVTPMPYAQLQQMLDESAPWGILAYDKALYLDELSDESIAVLAKHLSRKSSPMSFVPIFPLGGAYRSTDDAETAFGGVRTSRFALSASAVAPTRELFEADRQWARTLWEDLRPHAVDTGSYVNFMSEYEQDRVRAAYGAAKYDRLARIKATYDPDNVFHRNANIRPASAPA